MLDWLMANIGTIIVGTIVAAVVALIIVNRIRKRKRGESTCGCGCSDCPMKNNCH